MKRIIAAIFVFVGLCSLPAIANETRPQDGNTMQEIRSQALALSPDKIGVNRANFQHEVWGVLMEDASDLGSRTLIALANGTVNLYLSDDNGAIIMAIHGDARDKRTWDAFSSLLAQANQNASEGILTSEFPLPSFGQTNIYVLTFGGVRVLRLTATESDSKERSFFNILRPGQLLMHELLRQAKRP